MRDVNRVILMGRLGADAVLRKSKKGHSFACFSLATTRYWPEEGGDPQGKTQWNEKTTWHQVVVWGRQADICGNALKKGMPVFVDGELRGRSYDSADGDHKYLVEVHAETVSLLSGLSSYKRDQPLEAPAVAAPQVSSASSTEVVCDTPSAPEQLAM